MKTEEQKKYFIDKIKVGGFMLYTIWSNETQKPIFDFYSRDFKNSKQAREKAELKLNKLLSLSKGGKYL